MPEVSTTRLFLRILLVFGLVVGAYYAFAATDLYQTWIFEPYVRINAWVAGAVLGLLGYDATVAGATIQAGGFLLEVGRGCDGIEPTMLFVAAVLAFPAPFKPKLVALLVATPLLAAVNVVRVVSLQLVGIHAPDLFQLMHVEVWQVLYIAIAITGFAGWLLWATSGGQADGPPAEPA